MRAFIGMRVKPNEQLRKALSFLSKQEGVKAVEDENLHINLKFLGEIDKNQAELIKKVLEKIRVPPFEVKVKGIGFFPSEEFIKVVFAEAEASELIELNSFIEKELYSKGFMKENRDYVPHITLARVKRRLSEEVVGELKKIGRGIDFSFEASEVELIESVLTKEKPFYETIFKKQLK